MADAERAALLGGADGPSTRSSGSSKWSAKRWRAVVAVGATACLLAGGLATGSTRARAAGAALGSEDDQVKRQIMDARLQSVFGISLKDFAALVRGESESGSDEKAKQHEKWVQAQQDRARAAAEAKAKAAAEAKAAEEAKAKAEADAKAEAEAKARDEATRKAQQKAEQMLKTAQAVKAQAEKELKAAAEVMAKAELDLQSVQELKDADDTEPLKEAEPLMEAETSTDAETSEVADAPLMEADPSEVAEPSPVDTKPELPKIDRDEFKNIPNVPAKAREREERRLKREKERQRERDREHKLPRLGSLEEYEDGEETSRQSLPVLPVFFHTEKSGGTSLALHTLELLSSEDSETMQILNRVRNEDVMLDSELRQRRALCPGSAMFLSTVWESGSVWEPGVPRPLEDQSDDNWRSCRMLTSHTARELLVRAEEDEDKSGLVRPKFLMGLFRDPVEYEQAAWRSDLFMYHDLRAELGWGKLADTPLGTAIPPEDLHDFSANSKFAQIMLQNHCAHNLEANFQTRKLLEDDWWWAKDRPHGELLDIAKSRVSKMDWIGLTDRFDEGACMLAYELRKKPLPTSSSNYDRGKLLPETLRGNHPHSGDHREGEIDPDLKKKLYECNDLDTEVYKLAEQLFETKLDAMMGRLSQLVREKKMLNPVHGGGDNQALDPILYLDCMNDAVHAMSD